MKQGIIMPLLVQQQQQQQQMAVAAAAALSFLDFATNSSGDESARATAVASFHRLILLPELAAFLRRSSHVVGQALEQLTMDKSFIMRQAAAAAYGALGAMSSGALSADTGQTGSENSGSPADLFMSWALLRLTEATFGTERAALALAGVREFLAAGDVTGAEPFVQSILEACQSLLENEMPLLEPLLGVLTMCGSQFSSCLEPYFVDMVDLLLGWALDPEHPEGDRRLIVDSFLKFQPMWARSPQFSLNLLTKFLGDMEILAHDQSPPTLQQLHRLLALASCFVAVMQATATGLEDAALSNLPSSSSPQTSLADVPLTSEGRQLMDKLHVMEGAAREMLPRIITCFITLGQKFWDFRWLNEACRCLTLFAEVLKEDFAEFYTHVLEVLFQALAKDSRVEVRKQYASVGLTSPPATATLSTLQVQVILQVNMRMILCQRHNVSVKAVSQLLGWSSPISSLRLHPSRIVRGIIAATYMLLLQHGSEEVATEASRCLTEELEGFKERKAIAFQGKAWLQQPCRKGVKVDVIWYSGKSVSDCEVKALFRFDVMVLLARFCFVKSSAFGVPQADKCSELPFIGRWVDPSLPSLMELKSFIMVKLNPFKDPFQWHPSLQLTLWQALIWRYSSGFGSELRHSRGQGAVTKEAQILSNKNEGNTTELSNSILAPNVPGMHKVMDFGLIIALGLDTHASVPIKLEALSWLSMVAISKSTCKSGMSNYQYDHKSNEGHILQLIAKLLGILLMIAYDREPRVRAGVAVVLDLILQGNMVKPSQFQPVALAALKQLKDPDPSFQTVYQRVAWAYSPAALWMHGWEVPTTNGQVFDLGNPQSGSLRALHGKQLVSDLQPGQHLRVQQLSWILNYLSQRAQVLPSHWLQRMIYNFPGSMKISGLKSEGEEQESLSNVQLMALEGEFGNGKIEQLENWTCNVVLALWWAVQEASRHCVTVRLRTHLGGPTQTFAALERMLLDVPHLCRIDFGRREVAIGGMSSPTTVQLLPLRLLLEFVEFLKKDIYNAFEGSVVLISAPNLSSLFFRANRKVCEEWFARIRDAFINASVATQCHAGTILHAALHLQDLRAIASPSLRDPRSQLGSENIHIRGSNQGDLFKVLQHASLALCRAHEADALLGLRMWVKSVSQTAEDYLSGPKISTSTGPSAWFEGLIFQAQGQYEKAVGQYNHLLQLDDVLTLMGADGIQFTIARTIESYVALADWESLDLWVQELQLLRTKHAGKAYCGALTTSGNDMNAIYALARFDAGDASGAWGYLDLTPQSRSELTADPWQALHRSEQMLLQAMLQKNSTSERTAAEISVARAMVEEGCQVAMLDGLTLAAPFLVQLECLKVYETFRNTDNPEEVFHKSIPPNILHFGWPLDHMHQDCQPWLKLLRVYRFICPGTSRTLQLQQQLVRLARKQLNLRLAQQLLQEVLGSHVASVEFGLSSTLQQPSLSGRLLYEGILLLHAEGKQEDAILSLWQFVEDKMSLFVETSRRNESMDITNAKACLKLATWLRGSLLQPPCSSLLAILGYEVSDSDFDASSFFSQEDTIGGRRNETFLDGGSESAIQQIVGASIKAATLFCPQMAKAWFYYGYWCFNYAEGPSSMTRVASGRGTAFLSLIDEESVAKYSHLTVGEVASIRLVVSQLVTGPNSDTFKASTREGGIDLEKCVEQIVSAFKEAAGSAGSEDIEGEPPFFLLSLQLQRQLQSISSAWSVAPAISELMQIWWALRCRQVALFRYSARGFLQYLALSNQRRSNGGLSEQVKPEKEDCMLSASLYLLRILVNYGVELEESLQEGLLLVPPSSWQAITAQILARLSSHPESRVRKQLQGLLMSSVNLSPWAIVYPLLVDMNASDRVVSEELQDLRDCLVKLHPKLARDVKLMVDELGAITVFWDEQWLSTLQDLRTDVMRRITALKHEAARVAENATLSHSEKVRINAAKYLAMMAPVVVALERRLASTSRPPETPQQTWFQEQFGSSLKFAIEIFKAPPVGSSSLSGVWCPFDAITADLVNHQKKSDILLSDVSPGLTALQSSEAPMPGLGVHSSIVDRASSNNFSNVVSPVAIGILPEIITVASFSSDVTVLSTKTKPKKLQIVGSDGGLYPYLLKGREDLRLDARIMQLLQAVNSMLLVRSDARGRGLTVRHYSVTPISGRAGLIQWIDNLTSMYSVYKAWQERAVVASGSNGSHLSVPRPSDLFYGKIIPALKEKGLRKVISRRDWPQDVKRNVLLELIKETPRQLLHNELWCASKGLNAFRVKLHQFSGSVAVISILGYILGLGDRHLDNILVDFSSGDVVHIDYNVCFDKGLRLKIPEIVPFRLTHTIQAALGLTGVEGVFRKNCEAVLSVLQSNKEILLMLLQVFIWDPLVEWMRGDGHDEAVIGGEERKGMELAVSLSLFASRLQEIRVPLQEHHDQLLTTLPAAALSLESLVEADDMLEKCVAAYTLGEQNRRAAVNAEVAAMSLSADATSDLVKAQEVFSAQARELENTKVLVIEAAGELIQWVKQRAAVLDALRLGSLAELESIGQVPSPAEALSLKSAVLTAGVPLTIVPETAQVICQEIDQQVAMLSRERHDALLLAVQCLRAYSAALQRLIPINYVSSSHVHSWAEVLQVLSQDLSPDVLAVARRRGADLIAQCHGLQDESIQQKYNGLRVRFEQLVRELQKLKGNLTDLEAVNNPDAVLMAKDRFLATVASHLQGLTKDTESQEADEKQTKYMFVLQNAIATLYKENRENLKMLHIRFLKQSHAYKGAVGDAVEDKWFLEDLKQMVDKCVLLSESMAELRKVGAKAVGGRKLPYFGWSNSQTSAAPQWALRFTSSIFGVRDFCKQMARAVFPEAINAAMSHDPGVMEVLATLSCIRENIDRVFQKDVELGAQQLGNLEFEMEQSNKVGETKGRQALQESAAARRTEHLSWEEIESLGSEGENHMSTSLDAAGQQFTLLVNVNHDLDSHIIRGKVLLAAFAQLFSGLESLDQGLTSLLLETTASHHFDLLGESVAGNVWKHPRLSQEQAFFIWKVRAIEGLLDLCVGDASTIQDPTVGSEQVLQLEKRLRSRLLLYLGQYLGHKLIPVLLLFVKEAHLLKGSQGLSEIYENPEDWISEEDTGGRALKLLREYCNIHESVRAANAASASLRSQAEDLMLALDKVHMEAAQMEWLNELILSSSLHQNQFIGVPKSMRGEKQGADIAWWNRQHVRKNLYAASTAIRQATEGLQEQERAGLTAEGELERAVEASAWGCPSPGLPATVQEHFHRRRQLLRSSHEQAVSILRLCEAVLEFEASRDGFLSISPGDGRDLLQSSKERGRMWQQTYFDVVSRLESAYISFTNLKAEWQSTVARLESARVNLSKVANELQSASSDAESGSGAIKIAIADLKAQMKEAATHVSAVSNIVRGHTALTLDAGQMLEEVLAITEGTEGADDVHGLAKDASAEHAWLMTELSTVKELVLPLEQVLTSGAPLANSLARLSSPGSLLTEGIIEQSLVYGLNVSDQSHLSLRDTSARLSEIIPGLLGAVRNLHTCLSKLIRTASSDAGFLHKALAGVGGENQEEKSPKLAIAATDARDEELAQSGVDGMSTFRPCQDLEADLPIKDEIPVLQMLDDCWISAPDSGESDRCQDSFLVNASSELHLRQKIFRNVERNEKVLHKNLDINSSKGISSDSSCIGALTDVSETIFDLSSAAASSTNSTPIRSQHSGLESWNDRVPSVSAVDLKMDHYEGIDKISGELLRPQHPMDSKPVVEEHFPSSASTLMTDITPQNHFHTGKNAHAVSVLKRVQMKLEGLEVDGSRHHGVAEQVDSLLRQATGIDNLSNMYEGWTPWV